MCTVEEIRKIQSIEIKYKSGNKLFKANLSLQQFRTILALDNLNSLYPDLYDLVIAGCFDVLDKEITLHNLTKIDSFYLAFKDDEGYTHSISKNF